jgi:alpha-galactosidase
VSGPNVAIIGAGGFVFPLVLIRDMLSLPSLRRSSIRLYDIDQERAATTEREAQRLIERHELEAGVSVSADRTEALTGAEFVICAFQIGGLDAYRCDVEIPREYGIDQPVGDTLGPGGIFRGLRTIAALRELAVDMRRVCSGALLIQYANPMSVNCWATDRLGVPTVGLCHSVQHTSRMLAEELGVPYEEVTFDCAGVNHTAWFTSFRHGQTELTPAIRELMTARHLADSGRGGEGPNATVYEGSQERVRTELMRLTGFFHTESSHHASEYWPWFRTTPDRTRTYIEERWDYFENCTTQHLPAAAEQVANGPLRAGEEYAAYLIDSIVTGTRRVVHGNVRNAGLIPNLPYDACVEVACVVDRGGVRPLRHGPLPAACAALNSVQVNVQRLVVEAGLSGDRALVHLALALDPLTGAVLSLPSIRELTDRLLEAEACWLPQFDGKLGSSTAPGSDRG